MDGVKCVIVIHEMGEIFMRVAIASDHGGYRLKAVSYTHLTLPTNSLV